MAKILIISKFYYPFQGGIEQSVRAVAEYACRFHDITVLAFNHLPGDVDETLNGVKIIRRHVQVTIKNQPIALFILRGIHLNDYDLIHFHSPNPFVNGLLLVKQLFSRKTPLIVTHHMDIFGRKWLRALCLPMIRALMRNSFVTTVTSAKNISSSRDLPKDGRYAVVPLSIDPVDFDIPQEMRQTALTWRKSLSGTAHVIGFVGRHARYKGLHILIEALALLPDVHAFIGGDGPYRQSAENLAEEIGVKDRVHFLGHLSHETKLRVLAAIDVFVFPSTEITEAFGVSQMEAMLGGVPVVASNLPTGVTDVALDEKTALLASPGDVTGLASQINRILVNPQLAQELSQAARTHILASMTHQKVGAQMVSLFEDAMRNRSAARKDDV